MNIIDANGKTIEIGNLDSAMALADAYRQYHHENAAFRESDRKLQAYWEDIFQKLAALKAAGEQAMQNPISNIKKTDL